MIQWKFFYLALAIRYSASGIPGMQVASQLSIGTLKTKKSNTILWNIQGQSFVLSGISRGKVKNEKFKGFLQKVYPQLPSNSPPICRTRSMYQVSQKCKIDTFVFRRIKSVFSKLALILRVWQRNFFTTLERRVKQKFTVQKEKSPFKNSSYII